MTPSKPCFALAGAVLLASSSAFASDAPHPITQTVPSADACTRTVQVMGASMGYSALPGEKPAYLFVVRVNGVDYNAVCDAATGTVKDVTPRQSQ